MGAPYIYDISHLRVNLITTLHVLDVTITHLQQNKTTVTTASGNHYTVLDTVKFTDKEYR
jgi:hypothetical protein